MMLKLFMCCIIAFLSYISIVLILAVDNLAVGTHNVDSAFIRVAADTLRLFLPNNEQPRSTLKQGQRLKRGESLVSKNGKYRLTMQHDGNLVAYNEEKPFWDTKTVDGSIFIVQVDGNTVLYDSAGKAVWESRSHGRGNGPYKLTVEDDQNIVCYHSNSRPMWTTNTVK